MCRNCVATGGVILALAFSGPLVGAGLAQRPAERTATAAPPGEAVTLAPIECWWRTSTSATRVGEWFTLVLTCSVVETRSTTVVPDQSRLDPSVLQIPPFEVVRGTQATDVRTGTHRFFQYEYIVRYVGEEFGKDLSLPPLTISYRVQSRVQQDAAVEGRERQYILPAQTIRILSLVSSVATDIRDPPAVTFRQVEARRFQASVLRVLAGSLYVVGALAVMSGFARVVRRRQRRTSAARLAFDSAILRRVSGELDEVRRQRGLDGWTDRLAARALAVLRIAATYAVSRPVTQVRGEAVQPSDGQFVVPARWPRRNAALVHGWVTSVTLSEERRRIEVRRAAADGGGGSVGGAERLADLEGAMGRFSGTAYGREGSAVNDAGLDEALDVGARELGRLRREHAWLAKKLRAMTSRLKGRS